MNTATVKLSPASLIAGATMMWMTMVLGSYLIVALIVLPFTRSLLWFGSPAMWWVIVNAYVFARILLYIVKKNREDGRW